MTLADRLPVRAASEPPDISVVVPTFKRDRDLRRLLERLARQEAPAPFEVVVVDDARSHTVPPLIADFVAEHPWMDVRLFAGACRGPAAARNIGWRSARGATIAFIDDDAYPADDRWLEQGCAALMPGVDLLPGRVIVPLDGVPTDFQRNVLRLQSADFLTCNAFVRRSALVRTGGFDERFTVPYREDSDLQFRIVPAGRPMHRAAATVVHPAPPGRFAISLRLQRYSMFNALLYKKHPVRYRREIESAPPLHYYAMLLALASATFAGLTGRRNLAAALTGAWVTLQAHFFLRRVRGASHAPRHLADMALTSLLIPFLSIYWRIRGAIRFRVLFF